MLSAILKAKGLTVIISELSAKRKEKAREAGVADYILDPSEVDVVTEVMKITQGQGADVAFECSSVNKVLDTRSCDEAGWCTGHCINLESSGHSKCSQCCYERT